MLFISSGLRHHDILGNIGVGSDEVMRSPENKGGLFCDVMFHAFCASTVRLLNKY